jgi:hypothetical protein
VEQARTLLQQSRRPISTASHAFPVLEAFHAQPAPHGPCYQPVHSAGAALEATKHEEGELRARVEEWPRTEVHAAQLSASRIAECCAAAMKKVDELFPAAAHAAAATTANGNTAEAGLQAEAEVVQQGAHVELNWHAQEWEERQWEAQEWQAQEARGSAAAAAATAEAPRAVASETEVAAAKDAEEAAPQDAEEAAVPDATAQEAALAAAEEPAPPMQQAGVGPAEGAESCSSRLGRGTLCSDSLPSAPQHTAQGCSTLSDAAHSSGPGHAPQGRGALSGARRSSGPRHAPQSSSTVSDAAHSSGPGSAAERADGAELLPSSGPRNGMADVADVAADAESLHSPESGSPSASNTECAESQWSAVCPIVESQCSILDPMGYGSQVIRVRKGFGMSPT